MRIATPAFFESIGMRDGIPSLYFQSGCIFRFKMSSCRQQMDGSCLLIQSATLWCFMGAFRTFTFRLIIERYDFNDAMLPVKSLFLKIVSFCSVSLLGSFYFIEPPLISPVGLVSWLQNWLITGDSGMSISPSILNDSLAG